MRGGGPSMPDVVEISKNAEALGSIYKTEAASMPSEKEQHERVMLENAKTLANLDTDIAADVNAAESDAGYCLACVRDFDSLCPQGWAHFFGGMCVAPSSYSGPCPPSAYFNALSIDDKANYETRCLACWPCQSTGHGGRETTKYPPSPSGPIR